LGWQTLALAGAVPRRIYCATGKEQLQKAHVTLVGSAVKGKEVFEKKCVDLPLAERLQENRPQA